jgi:predicted nucleic acid-binding Zn ribbon protein
MAKKKVMPDKFCKGCNNKITPRKTYCSKKCYLQSVRRTLKLCVGCGKLFTGNKYCSHKCFTLHHIVTEENKKKKSEEQKKRWTDPRESI